MKDTGEFGANGQEALANLVVNGVDTGSGYPDQEMTWPNLWFGDFFHAESIDTPVLLKQNDFHDFGELL
jgi:hypothetical protein